MLSQVISSARAKIPVFSRNSPAPRSPLVLFLHGLCCSTSIFRSAFTSPHLAHVSVSSIDLPGFGDSDVPEDYVCTIPALASAASDVIRSLAPKHDDIHVIAHSMGGAVALLMDPTLLGPNGPVRSMMIAEGNLIPEDCGIFSKKIAAIPRAEYLATQYTHDLARFGPDTFPYLDMARAAPHAVHDASVSLVVESAATSPSLLDRYLALPVPRVYVCGDRNEGQPVVSRLRGLCEPVKVVSDAGHAMMWDQPDAFYKMVADWIG